jgi:zinc D-Ala-D-Ala carboxypeptidase
VSKWRYFSYDTDRMLSCSCCGVRGMDDSFMHILDDLRHIVGFPLGISSGYRCPIHNSRVSSTGATGPHTTGKAVDIPVVGEKAMKVVEAAIARGFTGIGVKQNGAHGGRFIHVDMLTPQEGPRPWMWSY